MLPDSAHLQEEEARYANKHSPALPLYTVKDAQRAVRLFETFGYERRVESQGWKGYVPRYLERVELAR